jgi:simple sugar transport system ATP-binding protein
MMQLMSVTHKFWMDREPKTLGTARRGEIKPEELQDLMAGGQELASLADSLGGTV